MLKLIMILGIKEFQEELKTMLMDMEIPIFSKVDIEGYNTENGGIDMSNWFGQDHVSDFSVMFFAFVPEKKANEIMKAIGGLNSNIKRIRPFHAFQMPVEKIV